MGNDLGNRSRPSTTFEIASLKSYGRKTIFNMAVIWIFGFSEKKINRAWRAVKHILSYVFWDEEHPRIYRIKKFARVFEIFAFLDFA